MKIIPYQGHYIVIDENGNFYCSADTYFEAEKEIDFTAQN